MKPKPKVNTAEKIIKETYAALVPVKNPQSGDAPNQSADLSIEPSIRNVFARSLCAAHHLGSTKDRDICNDGTNCDKITDCLALADKTLTYLKYRNRLPKEQ